MTKWGYDTFAFGMADMLLCVCEDRLDLLELLHVYGYQLDTESEDYHDAVRDSAQAGEWIPHSSSERLLVPVKDAWIHSSFSWTMVITKQIKKVDLMPTAAC